MHITNSVRKQTVPHLLNIKYSEAFVVTRLDSCTVTGVEMAKLG
jgi:hypothetical protein